MSIDKRAISVKSYIGTESITDTYATHLANLGRGGCHSVDSNAQRNLIPVDRRRRFMLCVVADVGNGNPGLYWLNTPPNPTEAQLANNSFWEVVPIGFQLDGVLNLQGFVTAADLDLEDGTGSSGDLWIVDTGGVVEYPEIFNGQSTTLQAGDFIIYLNDKWNLVLTGATSVDWNNLAGKPNLFPPETHTHTISDITDFPDLSGVITNDRISGVITSNTDGVLLATIAAIRNYVADELAALNIDPPNLEDYYTKGEVDTEISNAVNAVDQSKWEDDAATTIKPKDNKTVTTEHISGLSAVATSNDYVDLDNKPDLSQLHTQNTDTKLANGTADEVSANQIKGHIESESNPHNVTKAQLGVDDSKWEQNINDNTQVIPKDGKTIPASIIDNLPDGSNWEVDGANTIKPKDNKKVDASHIENLPSGYDSTDFDVDLATKTTDDITEGAVNEYSKWEVVASSNLKVPTEAELNEERLSWGTNNAAGAFASPLKLPMAGLRIFSSGSLGNVGSNGLYWSSTVNGTYSHSLNFLSSSSSMNSNYRAFGFSVRLIVNGTFTQQQFNDNYLNETLVIEGITYGYVYNSTTSRIWLDRNLGATQVATSSTDAASYGWLYQWGRGTDGHQIRTSPTTSTLSDSDTPGHGNFILAPNSPNDWRSPQNNNLWQGVYGINTPTPIVEKLVGKNNLKASYNDLLDLPITDDITEGDKKFVTQAEKDKLAGIEAGAEVNPTIEQERSQSITAVPSSKLLDDELNAINQTFRFSDIVSNYEISYAQDFKINTVTAQTGLTVGIKLSDEVTDYVLGDIVTAFDYLILTVDIAGTFNIKGELL